MSGLFCALFAFLIVRAPPGEYVRRIVSLLWQMSSKILMSAREIDGSTDGYGEPSPPEQVERECLMGAHRQNQRDSALCKGTMSSVWCREHNRSAAEKVPDFRRGSALPINQRTPAPLTPGAAARRSWLRVPGCPRRSRGRRAGRLLRTRHRPLSNRGYRSGSGPGPSPLRP